jgi:uncharacterized protein (TIGR00369 family)
VVAEPLLAQGFSRAPIVKMLGLRLERAAGGHARVYLPFREDLQQGLGVIHGGVLALIADSACWFAAASKREGSLVTSVELKINFLRPARKTDLVAEAEVVQSGRRIVTARFEVLDPEGRRLAVGLSTLVPADVEHDGIDPKAFGE